MAERQMGLTESCSLYNIKALTWPDPPLPDLPINEDTLYVEIRLLF